MKRTVGGTWCLVPLAPVLLALGGCGAVERMAGTLSELGTLRGDIAAEFDEPVVTVNLNNDRYLTIGLVNSRRADSSADEKRVIAKRVADFAYAHYKSHASLDRVNVAFVKHRSFLVFNYTDSRDVYGFEAGELRGSHE